MYNNERLNIKDYGYFVNNNQQPLDEQIVVPFHSNLGEQYLISSKYRQVFFRLAQCFIHQQHVTTCGVASSVMVLNAIYVQKQIKRPLDTASMFKNVTTNVSMANFIWTEQNFFENTQDVLNQDEIMGKVTDHHNEYNLGMRLYKLSSALNIVLTNIHMQAILYYVNKTTEQNLNEFRRLIKDVMNSQNRYIITNYNLNIQCTELNCGHFSPIAAYDEVSDRLLLLDPWASFSPWVWVKLADFYSSMNTRDGDNYRGYIVIGDIS